MNQKRGRADNTHVYYCELTDSDLLKRVQRRSFHCGNEATALL